MHLPQSGLTGFLSALIPNGRINRHGLATPERWHITEISSIDVTRSLQLAPAQLAFAGGMIVKLADATVTARPEAVTLILC